VWLYLCPDLDSYLSFHIPDTHGLFYCQIIFLGGDLGLGIRHWSVISRDQTLDSKSHMAMLTFHSVCEVTGNTIDKSTVQPITRWWNTWDCWLAWAVYYSFIQSSTTLNYCYWMRCLHVTHSGWLMLCLNVAAVSECDPLEIGRWHVWVPLQQV